MNSSAETTDRSAIAGALQRGYERATARVQELAADTTASPASRFTALLREGSAALDAVDKDLTELHDELPPFPEGDWQQEALAELGNDSTIDDAEMDRRMAAAALVNEATDIAMSGQAADARTATGLKLIEHVETVAAHPWKDADLTIVSGHDASSRDEVIDRLDQLLRECGLATTRELSKQVAPPKGLEMANMWGGQARDHVAANTIRSLSFPAGAKLPQPQSGNLAPAQKVKTFLTSKIQQNGTEPGR